MTRIDAFSKALQRGWHLGQPAWWGDFVGLAYEAETQTVRRSRYRDDCDEWLEVRDYLSAFPAMPTAWRARIEGEAEGWGHPVAVLEVLLAEHEDDEDDVSEWEGLWWMCDATEIADLRVFRMDEAGKVTLAMADVDAERKQALETAENA